MRYNIYPDYERNFANSAHPNEDYSHLYNFGIPGHSVGMMIGFSPVQAIHDGMQ